MTSERSEKRLGGDGLMTSPLRWAFGNAIACATERALWVADQRVELDRSALDVLIALLAADGDVVSKADLLRAAWPGRVVTENSVSKAISRIRIALDDADGEIIISDHGFGYRVRRPVQRVQTPVPGVAGAGVDASTISADAELPLPSAAVTATARESSTEKPPATTAPARRIDWIWPLTLALIVLIGAWTGIHSILLSPTGAGSQPSKGAPDAQVPVIAVMPFAHSGSMANQDVIATGLSLQLSQDLSRVQRVRVLSPGTPASGVVDPRAIGHDLGADFVLQGEVFGEGERLRVALRLNRCSDAALLWSQQFDRRTNDTFATQDEIARAVLDALRIKLLPEQVQGIARRPTSSPEAYAQYLLGQNLFRDDETGGRRALAAYERAVALDPDFTDAWYAIADLLGHNAFYSDHPAEALAGKRRALEIVETQLRKHPDNVDLIRAHGAFLYSHWWDWRGAEADFRRLANIVGEDDELLLLNLSRLRAANGDLDGAIALALRAGELNPLSTGWALAGYQALGMKRTQQAQIWVMKSIQADPLDEHAHYYLGLSELLQNNPTRALEHFDDSAHVLRLTGRAAALYSMGRIEESNAELKRLIELYAHVDAFRVAQVHAWRGETEQAFDWLSRARDQHEASIMYLKFDPLLDSLRRDPRFAALLASVNLSDANR